MLQFLSKPNCKDLVSGTSDRSNLHDKFRSRFEELYPGFIADLQEQSQVKAAASSKKSFWDSAADTNGGAFKFGFT